MGTETLEQETINLIISVSVLLIDLAIRIFLLFYIPRNRKPSSALAWLFAIALIPIGATILFFVIGRPSLSQERRAKQRYINELYQRYNRSLHRAKLDSKVPVKYAGAAKLGEELAYLAPTSHNKIELVGGYDEIIHELSDAIDRGSKYIYVEFFAMALDDATEPFFAALETARKRGVVVYVLFDYLGSKKYPNYRKMKKRLTAMGTQWRAMLPISLLPGKYNRPDLRNHRKIVVVDNTEAYLGSLNLIDKTYHRKDDISYIELVAHIEGPTVNESAAVFASDWYAETGEVLHHFMKNSLKTSTGTAIAQVIPSGPGYDYRNNLKVFVEAIYAAQKTIYISSPYFVPDDSLLAALTSAAIRGVRVCILNSEAMDQWMVGHAQRSYYEQLMKAGVEVWLFKKPQLLHSKYMVIDQDLGIIGSSNLDIRSFELNLESSVIAYDAPFAKKLHAHYLGDLDGSRQLNLKSWRKRSKWSQFLDSVTRLTSALQ